MSSHIFFSKQGQKKTDHLLCKTHSYITYYVNKCVSINSSSTYCTLYDGTDRMCYRLLVGGSSPWTVVGKEIITKEANLEPDCQEKEVLDGWSGPKGILSRKEPTKNFRGGNTSLRRQTRMFMELHFS